MMTSLTGLTSSTRFKNKDLPTYPAAISTRKYILLKRSNRANPDARSPTTDKDSPTQLSLKLAKTA